MVQNYEEWKTAVEKEYKRLFDVMDYLNDFGIERLRVFKTLSDMAKFNQTAAELLDDIRASVGEEIDVKKTLESVHASGTLRALNRIAHNTTA